MLLAAFVITAALGAGCRRVPAKITAVRIKAELTQTFDQLRFSLRIREGDTILEEPVVLPNPDAGVKLKGVEDFVVWVDDDLDGVQVTCGVTGIRLGADIVHRQKDVIVRRQQTVTCVVRFDSPADGLDGGAAGEAGTVTDADTAGDGPRADGGVTNDGARLGDGPTMADGALPADGRPFADTQVPPPDAQEPPPTDAPVAPADAGLDAPPVPPAGCRAGDRKAFIDRSIFPAVAGCGLNNAMSTYSQAIQNASAVCADGWHWCRPSEIAQVRTDQSPGQADGNCSWIDNSPAPLPACSQKLTSYDRLDCQGNVVQTSSAAGASNGAACSLVDPMCLTNWKLTVPLTAFNRTSVQGPGVTCLNHIGWECAGAIGGMSCWITCCAN